MKNATRFPEGWDEDLVRRLVEHYESQTEEEAVEEDEGVPEDPSHSFMAIPKALVPSVRRLLAQRDE